MGGRGLVAEVQAGHLHQQAAAASLGPVGAQALAVGGVEAPLQLPFTQVQASGEFGHRLGQPGDGEHQACGLILVALGQVRQPVVPGGQVGDPALPVTRRTGQTQGLWGQQLAEQRGG